MYMGQTKKGKKQRAWGLKNISIPKELLFLLLHCQTNLQTAAPILVGQKINTEEKYTHWNIILRPVLVPTIPPVLVLWQTIVPKESTFILNGKMHLMAPPCLVRIKKKIFKKKYIGKMSTGNHYSLCSCAWTYNRFEGIHSNP